MRNTDIELQKVTMNLFRGDYAKLQELYPDIGAATIIRRIVHKFIEQVEAGGDEPTNVNINI